nr:zinc finger, CCHC-type [Tanacetum cinerariifolium]
MKGYVEQLERLGYVFPQDLSVGLILNELASEFAGFVRNFNMHNMGKTVGEQHALLIEYEKGLPKKATTPQDDDDVKEKQANTRWNRDEEILPTEIWVEHSQNAGTEKDQSARKMRLTISRMQRTLMDRYGNKKFQYVHSWNILKSYPKWDAALPIDEDNLVELFGPVSRARPAGKPRPTKKVKSMDTSSIGGSTGGSIGGSQSESVTGVLSQDYRCKCEAAEATYEAKRKKGLGFLECRELEFLIIDPSLPSEKAAYIERKQAEIMKKYPNA